MESPQVTIHHISGILSMYASMVFVSTLIMIGENVYSRYFEANYDKRSDFPFLQWPKKCIEVMIEDKGSQEKFQYHPYSIYLE